MVAKKGEGKPVVDNSAFLQHTDFPMRDAVYNRIVMRYARNGHPWQRSDTFVWKTGIYVIWDWALILLFLYFMWWMFNFLRKSYDDVHAIAFLIIMVLWRLNVMVRKLSKLTK